MYKLELESNKFVVAFSFFILFFMLLLLLLLYNYCVFLMIFFTFCCMKASFVMLSFVHLNSNMNERRRIRKK